MELFLVLLVLLVALGFAAPILKGVETGRRKRDLDRLLSRITGFNPSQKLLGADGSSGIALNDEGTQVCLLSQSDSPRVFSHKDILSVEVFEDGETLTRTVRSSQAAGAIIGGLALGGVGAIIGGLSGSSRSSQKVKRVELRVVVNDLKHPTHTVCLLDVEVKKSADLYKLAVRAGQHWHALLDVLIKRADAEDKIKGNDALSRASVADELRKLADLWKEGALNDAQYEEQKLRLLG